MNIPKIGIELTQGHMQNLNDLVHQISLGKCCIFVGAGLSRGAGYPLWRELISRLKHAAEQLTSQEIDLSS
ncbi:MAG: hypothetical protein P8074_24210, partial [Anaerolineales bacterium]